MFKTISLRIFVDRPRDEVKVGTVQVTEAQFKAAIAEWDSPKMSDERRAWVRDRGESRAFRVGNRCYPPKKIMRIASREEVRKLAAKEKNLTRKEELEKGLLLMKGGYEVLDTYAGSEEFGFPTEGKLTPHDKEKCGC